MNMHVPHFNLRSKRFRKGFLDGFTAYYTVFHRRASSQGEEFDSTIGAAWRQVGCALEKAEKVERGKIGKTSGKSGAKSRISA